ELERTRVFAGVSGWGPDQLEDELERDDWIIERADLDDIFTEDPDGLWSSVLRRKGGEYELVARMPVDPSLNYLETARRHDDAPVADLDEAVGDRVLPCGRARTVRVPDVDRVRIRALALSDPFEQLQRRRGGHSHALTVPSRHVQGPGPWTRLKN